MPVSPEVDRKPEAGAARVYNVLAVFQVSARTQEAALLKARALMPDADIYLDPTRAVAASLSQTVQD